MLEMEIKSSSRVCWLCNVFIEYIYYEHLVLNYAKYKSNSSAISSTTKQLEKPNHLQSKMCHKNRLKSFSSDSSLKKVPTNLVMEYEYKINSKLRPETQRNSCIAYKETRPKQFNKSTANASIKEDKGKKWKDFALLLADSYDKLKSEIVKVLKENAEIKKVVSTLASRNQKLVELLKEADLHNKELIYEIENHTKQIKGKSFEKEYTELKAKYNYEVKSKASLCKVVENLKGELNKRCAACSSQENINTYKKLAHDNMNECKVLAEQLICLRSDLDNTTIQYLKKMQETTAETESRDKAVMTLSSDSRISDTPLKSSPHILNCHSNYKNYSEYA